MPERPQPHPAAEPRKPASYGQVLLRVMTVQVVTLLLLWLLQARFGG